MFTHCPLKVVQDTKTRFVFVFTEKETEARRLCRGGDSEAEAPGLGRQAEPRLGKGWRAPGAQ